MKAAIEVVKNADRHRPTTSFCWSTVCRRWTSRQRTRDGERTRAYALVQQRLARIAKRGSGQRSSCTRLRVTTRRLSVYWVLAYRSGGSFISVSKDWPVGEAEKKRRNVEAFSLSFLDCICCGFGAIILLLVLSKIYEPVIIEKDAGRSRTAYRAVAAGTVRYPRRNHGHESRAEESGDADVVDQAAPGQTAGRAQYGTGSVRCHTAGLRDSSSTKATSAHQAAS